MWKFLKSFTCGLVDSADSPGIEALNAEQALDDCKLVLPRFWVSHEESLKETTLRVKLPNSKREWIRAYIWNKRHFHLYAFSEQNRYKLQYKLPHDEQLLENPLYSTENDILACRFQESPPMCIVCATTFTGDSDIESKNSNESLSDFDVVSISEADSLSSRSSYELMQPRYWITYDDNMALFEANLKGCNGSEIKFHIDNDRLALLASSHAEWRYFLHLRLESSTQGGWNAYFDHKVEMLICSIPLLGHYKCDRCMAEGIRLDSELTGQSSVKAVGVKGAIYLQSKNEVRKKVRFVDGSTEPEYDQLRW